MDVYRKNIIVSLLSYAAQREVDVAELCRRVGTDLNTIRQGKDPGFTTQQFDDLWCHAEQLTNDTLLGLHLGESMRLGALGVIGELVQNSRTIGEALANAAHFLGLVTDLFTLKVTCNGKDFTLLFEPESALAKQYPHAFRHMLDLAMAFSLHEVDGLVLAAMSPRSVILPSRGMNNHDEYSRVLRCVPSKKSGNGRLVFDAAFWYEPIVLADYKLQQELLRKAATMRRQAESFTLLKERIAAFLLEQAYLGIPSLNQLAANFNTSPRSLQRRLSEEGVTYQELSDAVRHALAIHYLDAGPYALKEVAYMLGYNELSAFTRAFRRWTGATPAQYKAARQTSAG